MVAGVTRLRAPHWCCARVYGVRKEFFRSLPGTYSSARKRAPETWPGYYRVVPGGTAARKRPCENEQFRSVGLSRCPYFALDFGIEMPYPLAPPQGWEVHFDL